MWHDVENAAIARLDMHRRRWVERQATRRALFVFVSSCSDRDLVALMRLAVLGEIGYLGRWAA